MSLSVALKVLPTGGGLVCRVKLVGWRAGILRFCIFQLTASRAEFLVILQSLEDVTELVRANELGDELRGQTREMERQVIQRSHELAAALRELRRLGPLEDELADADSCPASQRWRLEAAHRNCQILLKLVNTLLDFSSIEAGRMQVRYEPTDLASLTADLASQFRSAVERAAHGWPTFAGAPPSGLGSRAPVIRAWKASAHGRLQYSQMDGL